MCAAHLTEWCRIPTSGARAVEQFSLDGLSLLAIPQLAYDIPDQPPDMNGGNSDTQLLILRLTQSGYEPFQTLFVAGGEDAEFFEIGDKKFLATASIRSGHGPYQFSTDSIVYRWTGLTFEPFQTFPTFAAKQWRYFTIEDHHFLALAQGVAGPETQSQNRASRIFKWNGSAFAPFQDIPSRWAYNWRAFSIDGADFLAHADHLTPSRLYRWDGRHFVVHQDLVNQYGRAFTYFEADGNHYLLVACIFSPPQLMRWDRGRFVSHAELEGLGARELALVRSREALYVVRINFILGSAAAPIPALRSQLYEWRNGGLAVVYEFPTFGGTDVTSYSDDRGTLVAVSNSLSQDVRFATDTVVYRFADDSPQNRGGPDGHS
jgi:EPTP domain-containing protein